MKETFVFSILIAVVLLYSFFFAYMKLYHKFWYCQPCFHFYKLSYYFSSPFVIQPIPQKTPYCNFDNIKTTNFLDATFLQLSQSIQLINHHFLFSKDAYNLDLKTQFLPYFSSHPEISFLTMYYQHRTLRDIQTHRIFQDKHTKLVGTILSRPLQFIFGDDQTIQINYVDFLCVHKQFRKSGVAQQLIQTHDFYQRTLNPAIKVSLFKREGDLMFINPLVRYQSFLVKSLLNDDDDDNDDDNNNNHKTHLLNVTEINEYKNLLVSMNEFDCKIYPSIPTIMELIKTKNLFIFLLKQHDDVDGFFVFKNCGCRNIYSCISSYKSKRISVQQFQQGFQRCLKQMTFSKMIIENISHNIYLLKGPLFLKMAYFFYNYVFPSCSPHKVFILL